LIETLVIKPIVKIHISIIVCSHVSSLKVSSKRKMNAEGASQLTTLNKKTQIGVQCKHGHRNQEHQGKSPFVRITCDMWHSCVGLYILF
jgi:hypothetical protein